MIVQSLTPKSSPLATRERALLVEHGGSLDVRLREPPGSEAGRRRVERSYDVASPLSDVVLASSPAQNSESRIGV
jgi:hypothetical protein